MRRFSISDFRLEERNWGNYVTKSAGTTDLNQSRTNNSVNEITGITETVGSSWIDPAYDAAGNMTTMPQPNAPTTLFTATYDAWNRLVKLVDGSNTVAEYSYDGRNQQIVKSIYVSGSLDHKEHIYYNDDWQSLEVRKETSGTISGNPIEQMVWHPFYIDAPILRDYDVNTSGSPTRHYYMFDANYNVTTLTTNTGAVAERYQYSPYGQLTVLDANFGADADGQSDVANPTTFTGRRYDAESGMYYFRNRMYHAQLGAWCQRDIIGYEDGMSLLAGYFVPNMNDPTGTKCVLRASKMADIDDDDSYLWLKGIRIVCDRSVKCLLAGGDNLGGFPTRRTSWHEGSEIPYWNSSGGSGWHAGRRVT